METPASQSASLRSTSTSLPTEAKGTLPDGPRVAEQLAGLAEQDALRPLLEFLRALLNARAVAYFSCGENTPQASVVVTTRGILATALAPLGERLARSSTAVVEPAEALGPEGYTLAVPLRHEQRPLAVLMAQLLVSNPRDLQAYLVLLQSIGGYIHYHEQRNATADIRWVLDRTGQLLEIFRRVCIEEDSARASRILVDALRDNLGCTQAAYAYGGHVRALSGISRVDAKSTAHQPLEAAIREATHFGRRVDYPLHADAIAHQLLAESSRARLLVTMPFESGALHLAWQDEPDPRTATLLDATLPFIPPLITLLERSRPNALIDHTRKFWRRASRDRRRFILTIAAIAVALLAFPFHYTIRTDCRLIPRTQRVVAAPFEGQLGRTTVRPGDRVNEGAVLIALDNRELKLREAELTAARELALKKRDRAMSSPEGADFAAAQVAALEAEGASQELALVQRKLSQLEIRAPLTGVIVAGDLRRAEGQPVRQGDMLFEIAPLDAMLVELEVPDWQVGRVREGMPVDLRIEAHGGWSTRTRLEKVYPRSEQREGRNVFLAEAPITGETPELRPGMRGRAAIESDRRPLAWQLTHRLWEWLEGVLWW